MPASASSHATEFLGLVHVDFLLGNGENTTASAALLQTIQKFLVQYGYGQPAQHRNSFQIEINREMYMHKDMPQLHAGLSPAQAHLKALLQQQLVTDPRTLQSVAKIGILWLACAMIVADDCIF